MVKNILMCDHKLITLRLMMLKVIKKPLSNFKNQSKPESAKQVKQVGEATGISPEVHHITRIKQILFQLVNAFKNMY